ncbi:hypothetical protein [Candidatus Nitrosotenuis uzonensis]|uniref:GIY-YIG domain-containing protein n=1 Tax=Candidatus Nitrosotenuis uzonensis TaxID=1407055 RepID=A0A812EZ28_9ARCH|nr:hypothetical protein [Candidatus Nitrosotenuis uzonensis]CAE6486000.1 hypothetical protein NUZ5A_20081 [Candidatus Nitrosotenuis uzonensis]
MRQIRVNFSPKGIAKLPKSPGVYISGCGKKIDYIGSSGNIRQRVKQQIRNGMDSCYIKAIPTKTRKQAFDLERSLISGKCPPANKAKPRRCKPSLLDQLFG